MKRYKVTWEYGPSPEEEEDDSIWYPGNFWGVPIIPLKDEEDFIKESILDALELFKDTTLSRNLIAIEPILKGAPTAGFYGDVTFSAISCTLGGDIHLYEEFGD